MTSEILHSAFYIEKVHCRAAEPAGTVKARLHPKILPYAKLPMIESHGKPLQYFKSLSFAKLYNPSPQDFRNCQKKLFLNTIIRIFFRFSLANLLVL